MAAQPSHPSGAGRGQKRPFQNPRPGQSRCIRARKSGQRAGRVAAQEHVHGPKPPPRGAGQVVVVRRPRRLRGHTRRAVSRARRPAAGGHLQPRQRCPVSAGGVEFVPCVQAPPAFQPGGGIPVSSRRRAVIRQGVIRPAGPMHQQRVRLQRFPPPGLVQQAVPRQHPLQPREGGGGVGLGLLQRPPGAREGRVGDEPGDGVPPGHGHARHVPERALPRRDGLREPPRRQVLPRGGQVLLQPGRQFPAPGRGRRPRRHRRPCKFQRRVARHATAPRLTSNPVRSCASSRTVYAPAPGLVRRRTLRIRATERDRRRSRFPRRVLAPFGAPAAVFKRNTVR